VHAWHTRRLADLPVAGRRVVIELQVRRLICLNTGCAQRTFRQQVPDVARRYARRTLRLTRAMAAIFPHLCLALLRAASRSDR
jgi:transposase